MKIKVLLISRNAWNNTNTNTLSNFFQNFSEDELAQVYCRDELPDNNLCINYFKIAESSLVKTLFGKASYGGEKFDINSAVQWENASELAQKEKRRYDFFRNNRLQIFLWIRELIWKFGKWKSPELRTFILDFKPDVIYTDALDTFYTYDVLRYVQSVANVHYVLFHFDDQVTYHQFSLSPLYWINRFFLRNKVAYATKHAAINYCIIDKQKEEYQKILNRDFKILNKCADFSKEHNNVKVNKPVKIIYAGNIYYGRLNMITLLAESINKINTSDIQFTFDIYTSNPVSQKNSEKLNSMNGVSFNGFRPYNEILDIQNQADILLHVESFRLSEKLLTSLSFSTKLVDYFRAGKCILALGWSEAASIEYLRHHKAAIIVSSFNEIENVLNHVANNPELITEYGQKAYLCGKKFHEKSIILSGFRNDLLSIKNQTFK